MEENNINFVGEEAQTLSQYENFLKGNITRFKGVEVESIKSTPKYYRLLQINPSSKRRKQLLICKYKGCRAQFKKISNLNYHLSVHDDKRPYKCSKCNKRFVLLGNLKRHKEQCGSSKPMGRNLACEKLIDQDISIGSDDDCNYK